MAATPSPVLPLPPTCHKQGEDNNPSATAARRGGHRRLADLGSESGWEML
jgi:hypothetical protein